MLTKNDLNAIQKIVNSGVKSELKPVKKDLSTLKTEVGILKTDVKDMKEDVGTLKIDVSVLKIDVSNIKTDITDMKSKINDFASFTIKALGSIADWTQDIHESIVKEKLPERVKKLEHILKVS